MSETYALASLIPDSIKVYKDREDYEDRSGKIPKTYDPGRANCYFEGDPSGLMKLDGNKLVPYDDIYGGVNIPGPYVLIEPVRAPVTFGGVAPKSPWFVTRREYAEEIAKGIGLPLLTSAQAGLRDAVGVTELIDAFFVKVAKFYTVNLGEAMATKAPYGEGSPGRWMLDERAVRIYWEPDATVNSKTMPTPYRPLVGAERLQSVGFGGVIVVKDGDAQGGSDSAGHAEILTRLDRIEGLLAQLLMRSQGL